MAENRELDDDNVRVTERHREIATLRGIGYTCTREQPGPSGLHM